MSLCWVSWRPFKKFCNKFALYVLASCFTNGSNVYAYDFSLASKKVWVNLLQKVLLVQHSDFMSVDMVTVVMVCNIFHFSFDNYSLQHQSLGISTANCTGCLGPTFGLKYICLVALALYIFSCLSKLFPLFTLKRIIYVFFLFWFNKHYNNKL